MFLNTEEQKCKPQIYMSQMRLLTNNIVAWAETAWLANQLSETETMAVKGMLVAACHGGELQCVNYLMGHF